MIIRFLLWVGFVKVGRKSNVCDIDKETGALTYRYPETIIWPFHVSPWWQIKLMVKHGRQGGPMPRFYRFKNLPGIIKWREGRLLPVRWGFGICGFEFGDRG